MLPDVNEKVSGIENAGTEPYKAILGGWVFPYISRIHTAYIGEDSSILGTTSMFGETWNETVESRKPPWKYTLED